MIFYNQTFLHHIPRNTAHKDRDHLIHIIEFFLQTQQIHEIYTLDVYILFRKAIMVKGYKLLGVGLKWVRPLSTDLYLFNYHKVSLRDPLKSMLNCLSSAHMWYGPSISLTSLPTTRRIVKSRRGLSTVPAGTPLVFFRRDSLSPVQLTTSVLQSLIFETR